MITPSLPEPVDPFNDDSPTQPYVSRARLEELARRIVNKLLHDPVKTLRASDSPHALGQTYLHAMEMLFQLDANSEARDKGGDHENE